MNATALLLVPYPSKFSEFEVQSEMYHQLRNEGFSVRGSVPARCRDSGREPRVYFDLVVFDRLQSAVCIIECKNSPGTASIGARQRRRYEQFNVPLLLCSNLDDVPKILHEVQELTKESAFA